MSPQPTATVRPAVRRAAVLAAAVLSSFAAGRGAAASDWTGVYATIDRVVLEPETGPAERVRIEGAFAVAHPEVHNAYLPPVRGALVFGLVEGEEELCRREWNDLRERAGKKEAVGIGSRRSVAGLKVRRPHMPEVPPAPYVLGIGVVLMPLDVDYAPIRALATLPRPATPADGARVAPGKVTLAAANIARAADKSLRYHFELVVPGGTLRSEPIAPGDGQTRWQPPIELAPGAACAWRVRVTGDGIDGAVAEAAFVVEGEAAAPTAAAGKGARP